MIVANAGHDATVSLKESSIFSSVEGATGSVPNSSLHLIAAAFHNRNLMAILLGKAGFQRLDGMRHSHPLGAESSVKSVHPQPRWAHSGQLLTLHCDFDHCVVVPETAITVASMPCCNWKGSAERSWRSRAEGELSLASW
jgi:hypothetical protein